MTCGYDETTSGRSGRGQSSVVGVALLLGATVVALGVVTASVGVLVDGHAARADADRVATDLQSGLKPVESTGHRSTTVQFNGGRLFTAERQLRISDAIGTVATVDIGAVVYERGDYRVAAVGGAVVRGRGENAWIVESPPVVGSESNGVLVVGAANLSANPASVGGGRGTVTLATNVTHDRRSLGAGRYEVAIETEAPAAFERYFVDQGATVSRADRDGDGVVSVVAEFPGRRRAYLVEHRMRLEVTNG